MYFYMYFYLIEFRYPGLMYMVVMVNNTMNTIMRIGMAKSPTRRRLRIFQDVIVSY